MRIKDLNWQHPGALEGAILGLGLGIVVSILAALVYVVKTYGGTPGLLVLLPFICAVVGAGFGLIFRH